MFSSSWENVFGKSLLLSDHANNAHFSSTIFSSKSETFPARPCLRPLLLSNSLRPLNNLSLARDLRRSATLGHLRLALGLQARRVLGKILDVGQEFGLARDVLAQHFGHVEALLGLVVLEHAAERTLGGAECGVEGVGVGLLEGGVGLLLLAVSVESVLACWS
jgi:hypothetical protein